MTAINLFKTTALVGVCFALVACGNVERADSNPRPHDAPQGEGLFSGKSGNMLDAFGGGGSLGGGLAGGAGIGVNPYLWRASLESVSFMPIYQADSAGGAILTDWYTNPNAAEEQFKVNILLLGRELSPSALNVSVFKRVKTANGWSELGAQETTANELEETILTNARSYRVRAQASQ